MTYNRGQFILKWGVCCALVGLFVVFVIIDVDEPPTTIDTPVVEEPCTAQNGCQCIGGVWHGADGKPETHQGQPIECVEEATQEEATFEDIVVEVAVVVNAANGLYQRRAQIDYLFVLEGSDLTHIKGIKFVRGLLSPISSLYSVAVQIGETMYWLGDWPKNTGEEIRCKAIFIPVGMMACHPINGV